MLGFMHSQGKSAAGVPFRSPQTMQPPKAAAGAAGMVNSRAQLQYDWEREIESLDQKEMELHQTQMKLIREQMTSFIGDLAVLKDEFDQNRAMREAEAVQTQALHEELHRDKQEMQIEIMALIQALQQDHLGHSAKLDQVAAMVGDNMLEDQMNEKHAALEDSLAQLHLSHGETVDQHRRELAALRDAHDSHATSLSGHQKQVEALHATIPERLAYLEQALGDSAEQHTGKLESAINKLDSLHGRMSACEAQNTSLGKMHKDLAGDKDAKHASLQERVDYLEGLVGDSADKHAKDLDALKTAHDKHAAALSKSSKFLDDHKDAMAGHHATLQERVDDIEKVLGLHADKHADGLAEHASKLELMHSRLATVEKFGGILEEVKRSHGNLAREKQELSAKHSSLIDRLDGMDQAFGENFDKHGKNLQALGLAHDKHLQDLSKHSKDLHALRAEKQVHHESIAGRLDSIERANDEASDKHSTGLSELHSKYQSTIDRLAGVEKHGNHIGSLQRSHDTLVAKKAELETSHASMGERVSYLEKMLGDSVEKHAKELRSLHDSHSKHSNDLDGLRSLHAKHSTVDERLDYLEQCIGDSADKHSEELTQLKRSHDALHGRLAACENNGSSLSELRKSHGSLASQKMQLEAHHASLKERVDYLEGLMNDSADKHNEKLEAAHTKLGDMHGRLAACERFGPSLLELRKGHADLHTHRGSLDSEHASFKDRLDTMQALFGDSTNRQTKDFKALKASHDKHASMLTKHASQLDGFADHKEQHASLPERMDYIEQALGDSADKHAGEVAELHKKIAREQAAREMHHGSIKDLLAREQEERGQHHASLNERVDYLENVIGDNADKHAREIASVLVGHHKMSGEFKSHGDNHGAVVERVDTLEKMVAETSERQSRDAKATKAKFETFAGRFAAVKEAWGQDTPRPQCLGSC